MKNIKNLIFDLDDTLYSQSLGINSVFISKIDEYFRLEKKLDEKELEEIKEFFQLNEVGIDSFVSLGFDFAEFLDYICDIDVSTIEYNHELKKQLEELPHKKIIYTNSTHKHMYDTLRRLRLDDLFKDRYSIEDADYDGKPSRKACEKFFLKFDIKPEESVLFEDNCDNLKTAKALGMKTILVSENEIKKPDYCDFVFRDINDSLKIFK